MSSQTPAGDYVWPVTSYQDLTPTQRACARDIIDAFHQAMRFNEQYALEVGQKPPWSHEEQSDENLWQNVFFWRFNTWDTSRPIPPKPELSESTPSPRVVREPVGAWKQDLPHSKCTLRNAKHRGTLPNGRKPSNRKKPPAVKEVRRQGKLAYIHAKYKEDSRDQLEFFYCDEEGKGAEPKYIRFGSHHEWSTQETHLVEHLSAKAMALIKTDERAAEYAELWNMYYLIYLMRCRLMRVLSDTVPVKLITQRLPNPTAMELKAFVRPNFIEPLLLKRPATGDLASLQQFLRYWRKNPDIFCKIKSLNVKLPEDFWQV